MEKMSNDDDDGDEGDDGDDGDGDDDDDDVDVGADTHESIFDSGIGDASNEMAAAEVNVVVVDDGDGDDDDDDGE